MPRTLSLIAALALAGCGADAPDAPDAGTATTLMGTWSITWTCIDGCTTGALNPLAYDDVLVIAADGTAAYASTTCADCAVVHAMTMAASCLTVPAGADFGVARAAYQACSEADVLSAEVTWSGFPGPAEPRTFHLVGSRPPP